VKKHQKVLCVVAFVYQQEWHLRHRYLVQMSCVRRYPQGSRGWAALDIPSQKGWQVWKALRCAACHWPLGCKGNRLCLSVPAEAPANCSQVGHAGKI
jgi:hypothetical protein